MKPSARIQEIINIKDGAPIPDCITIQAVIQYLDEEKSIVREKEPCPFCGCSLMSHMLGRFCDPVMGTTFKSNACAMSFPQAQEKECCECGDLKTHVVPDECHQKEPVKEKECCVKCKEFKKGDGCIFPECDCHQEGEKKEEPVVKMDGHDTKSGFLYKNGIPYATVSPQEEQVKEKEVGGSGISDCSCFEPCQCNPRPEDRYQPNTESDEDYENNVVVGTAKRNIVCGEAIRRQDID